MLSPARHRHLIELQLNFINYCGHNLGVCVRYLHIVNVPCNGALLTVDVAVCDARVIWVQYETHLFQMAVKQAVPKKG